MLILFDGTNYLYRAYFVCQHNPQPHVIAHTCLRLLTTTLKELKVINPRCVFALDSRSEKNFRKQIYPEYKANREKDSRPQEIVSAIKILRDMLKGTMVYACYSGVEADDVIASYAMQSKDPVVICSSDKDFKQLIRRHITVYHPMKRQRIDRQAFIQEYGFKPRSFVDYLALQGDKIDNIPGVKGIGHATAVSLLREYGNLNNVYANIDTIKGATQTKLINSKDDAFMSYKLAKMKTNIRVKLQAD